MALPAPHAPYVRITHSGLPGEEAYVTIDTYRGVMYALGWRSPLDDPTYDGSQSTADVFPQVKVDLEVVGFDQGRWFGRKTTTGAPTTGTWAVGDEVTDSAGGRWVCTAAGTPGTWVSGTSGIPQGGPLTADLAAGGFKVTGLADPTSAQDAATRAYVLAVRDALIASAPGVLDTLDELAAALGDDANFATTVTNALAGKQPLDSDLSAIAALISAADKLAYATGAGTWALTDLTAIARTLLAAATASEQRAVLELDATYATVAHTHAYLEAVGGGKATYQDHGAMGAAETIDLALASAHRGQLDANCTLTFTGATNGKECVLRLTILQAASGGPFTVTWPSSVKWSGTTVPTLSTGANARDRFVFVTEDNGATWDGAVLGQAYGLP